MNRPESIALVDISYLFKKRYHTIGNDTPMAAAKATLEDIEYLAGGVAHLIVCRDAPPYSSRTAIYPEYKAHRPQAEPEEIAQKRWLWEKLKHTPFNVAWSQGHEADDIIATLCKVYGAWCKDIRIVATDKDCAQCITANVKQYIPPEKGKEWEVRDTQAVIAKWGVFPGVFPLYQALVGDKTDNIPGVKDIGPVKAKLITNQCQTLERVQAWMVQNPHLREAKLVGASWENLVMSLKLVTLKTDVELNYEGLLMPREVVTQDGVDPQEFETALQSFDEKQQVAAKEPTVAARSAETEEWRERERRQNEEHEAREAFEAEVVPQGPGLAKTKPAPQPARRTALATVPAYTTTKYGMVTSDLQPLDLESGIQLAKMFAEGGLYAKKFKNWQQIFTIVAKGRELGLKMTVALDGFHVIEGKPSPSADLIRALAERDPNFEYLMCMERSPTRCVWRGKHKQHPTYVDFPYTIEEAKQAGLVRPTRFGEPSNWMTRPQDMLSKTAGSKLARELWPMATQGLYCPEEMGYDVAELEAREAA